ncbi:MAG: DUF294 nucleotidyltransferase-like domain-containing protein [Geminicoccaceae bacterium]
MTRTSDEALSAWLNNPPFADLPAADQAALVQSLRRVRYDKGTVIYDIGSEARALFLLDRGRVATYAPSGEQLSALGPGDLFGERGLLRDGIAPNSAVAETACQVFELDAASFHRLYQQAASFRDYFAPRPPTGGAPESGNLATARIGDLMTVEPLCVAPERSVRDAAQLMAPDKLSALPVVSDARLIGILTTGDITARVVARGLDMTTPVSAVMTPDPLRLDPDSVGFDALLTMAEHGIEHLPIEERGRVVGLITANDLIRRSAASGVFLLGEIRKCRAVGELTAAANKLPDLLQQLVAANLAAHKIGQTIANVTDALTRRLIALAERRLGPPPVAYVWLACGSQGRQEQTGYSDQDNCLILDDVFVPARDDAYFAELASFVCDGLDACGFYHCPGEMMATTERWRQPLERWRGYFHKWINEPDPTAQMLASVMFDLRAIHGEHGLLAGLVEQSLAWARGNSIFRAHMVSNSLKHTPPLGLFGGLVTMRKGEHRRRVDLKMNGVVPIVDLARVYALQCAEPRANTRARLHSAIEAGVISTSGGHDLLDAFELISKTRLEHQARCVQSGEKPDNFMAPHSLSAFERNHLRHAFLVVKTMQAALAKSASGPT